MVVALGLGGGQAASACGAGFGQTLLIIVGNSR